MLNASCINHTLSQLPDNITDLEVIVDKFPDNGVSFSRFTFLSRLAILWTYSAENSVEVDLSKLTDCVLFAGLKTLTSLTISIPTSMMNDSLLLDLVNLKELDLSNIGHFSTKKFADLYRESQLENKPLESLILKRMSGVFTAGDRLFLLKELLPLLKGSQITTLDMSENRELYLYPGLMQYLPQLRVINMSENAMRYIDKPFKAKCAIIELVLHPNFEVLDVTNLGDVGAELDYFSRNFTLDLIECIIKTRVKNNCVCATVNRTCGEYFPEGIDCSLFPEFTLADIVKKSPVKEDPSRYCDQNVVLPFPRSLKVLRAGRSNYKDSNPNKGWRNQTLCFQPNNLTELDVSYCKFGLKFDSNMLTGIYDKLLVLDMAFSSWGYNFHDQRFLHPMARLEILNATGTDIGVYISNDTFNEIFKMSSKLKVLLLRSAKLSSIPLDEFANLHNLETLDISNNGLKQVSFRVSSLFSLSCLNLTENKLYQLTDELTSELEKLFVNTSDPIIVDLRLCVFVLHKMDQQNRNQFN